MSRAPKITLRLTVAEEEALFSRAQSLGMTRPGALIAMLRTTLLKVPHLNGEEVQTLLASNRELLAIGRNLNQITRRINSGDINVNLLLDTSRTMEEVVTEVATVTGKMYAVCDRSINRW